MLEIGGEGTIEYEMLPAGGMSEAEQASVQGLTTKRRNLASDADAPRDSTPGARAVKRIPDQRMAPMGKMNPYLMCSAGAQTAFEVGRLRVMGQPLVFAGTPTQDPGPPPLLGQHTDEILGEAGYDAAAIADLRAKKVVR